MLCTFHGLTLFKILQLSRCAAPGESAKVLSTVIFVEIENEVDFQVQRTEI